VNTDINVNENSTSKSKFVIKNSGMGNRLEWPQRYLFITEKNSKFDWSDDKNDKLIPKAIEVTNFMDHPMSSLSKSLAPGGKMDLEDTMLISSPKPSLYLISSGTKTMIVPASGVKGSFLIVHCCPNILSKRLRKCETDDYNNNSRSGGSSSSKLVP
jgi:hypothetical protein